MVGVCDRYGRQEKYTQSFLGKPEGRKLLGILRRNLEDNIKGMLKEIGGKGLD
jgi:hypothetical protein